MTINGTDISEYDAKVKQWRFEPDLRSISNSSVWEKGSPLPIFQPTSATFKDFTVTLMVFGDGRDDIELRISNIMAMLMGTVEIKLDGWTHFYCGILEKSSTKDLSETSKMRFKELSLQFTGYEHGEEVTVSGSGASLTITNPGNVLSPAVIEIIPTVGQASVTLTGICRDSETGEDLEVTVNNLTTGQSVVLDGISGLITESGELKAGDVDMWALPTLLPGDNTISLSTKYVEVNVTILPMYM